MTNKISKFFNINKPIGITSNTALSIFKRKTLIKKCGYAGTLDPFASGVLPIATNNATKLITDLVNSDKEYEFIAKFGATTDTGDLDGKITATSNKIPTIQELENAIKNNFLGIIRQAPSVYSAIKINGERLCDLARQGDLSALELEQIAESRAKDIEIFKFDILEKIDIMHFRFLVVVSKGTYVRKLASDLAEKIGSRCHLISLIRNRVGEFKIEDSLKLENLDLLT